jgi:hypothetical protein
MQIVHILCNKKEIIPVAMADPTPAKTKRKVVMNSTTRALIQSGCVASRLVPKAIFAMLFKRSNNLFCWVV